ncbi:uncharacterized protein LOC124942448 [Impatiens glandulifera]|uniref:uncharacterized protein LOC124942448 n=1 Tax=Impatiens glandulifera TaxID=253017 RepID=UPI001FB1132F|nr:uncharacterized protein LOC124942448 [Impatiens glandulifera]
MKITNKTDPFAILLSSRTPDPSSDSILTNKPKNHNQSRFKPKNPGRSGGRVRVRRDGSAPVGRRSRPETPLLRWKYHEVEKEVPPECSRKIKGKGKEIDVSARKLAGVLWRLHLPEKTSATAGREAESLSLLRNTHLGFQDGAGHSPIPYHLKSQDVIQNPWSDPTPKNEHLCKFAKSFKLTNSALEGATKWNPVCDTKSIDQNLSTTLKVELEQAQTRIHELESEKRSSKKKLEHFLRKLSEERSVWKSKEHEKIRAVIDEFKTDLNKEKKTRQRLEHLNSKLSRELADAKLLAKRYMHDFDKERKGRVLIEEVCDELAKEIGEDKAEAEALKEESLKLREEVEDERKMLQMAEVWREERVQMKLIDAKVAIEERYSYMNTLVFALEAFLSSVKTITEDESHETSKAEFLCQSARSLNIQEITEFSYDPPKSDDIFAVFEDVNMAREANNNEIPDEEDESGWETVSHRDSNYSGSVTEENVYEQTPVTETRKAKPKKGSTSISRLWRSNVNNGEKVKTISVEPTRFSNETAITTEEVELGQWSSPEVGNSHIITRGIKGCIEWPLGGMQKNSLKSKLLEARMESQKIQLRQALKQKI